MLLDASKMVGVSEIIIMQIVFIFAPGHAEVKEYE
jgi:hypothetical protein